MVSVAVVTSVVVVVVIAVAIGIRWTIAVAVHPRATTIAAVVVVATIAEDHPPPHRRAPCTEEEDATTRTATAVVDEEVVDAVLRRRRTAADAVVPVPHPRGTVVVDAVAVRQPRRRGVRTMMITIAAVDTHVVPVVAVPVLLHDGEPVPSRIGTFTVEIVIVGIAGRMQMNGQWRVSRVGCR